MIFIVLLYLVCNACTCILSIITVNITTYLPLRYMYCTVTIIIQCGDASDRIDI